MTSISLCRNIPLSIASTKDGKTNIDTTVLLQDREATIAIDTRKPFKLNAGTTGVCECLRFKLDWHLSGYL